MSLRLLLQTVFADYACFTTTHSGFFLQAEDGIRGVAVTGVQTCALPILGQNDGIEIVGVITSSNNISSSGIIYAANIIIDSLPTSEATATSNGFFTLSGSQIPLSGSAAQLNAISESKFVFQK